MHNRIKAINLGKYNILYAYKEYNKFIYAKFSFLLMQTEALVLNTVSGNTYITP